MKKDVLRPIVGTIALQPPAYLWCILTDTAYWSNMGIFTILATIYLMPVYALYEKYWGNQPTDILK